MGFVLVCAWTVHASAFAQQVDDGVISGRITDDQGRPIEHVRVAWHRGDAAAVAAFTDADGKYSISHLSHGDYQIEFLYPFGRYAGEWYDDAPTRAEAQVISLTPLGHHASGVDAVLGPGARVTGRITNAAGEPLPEMEAHLCLGVLDTTSCLAPNDPTYQPYLSDDQGRYEAYGYLWGPYRLIVRDPAGRYLQQYWPGGPTAYESETLEIEPGETRAGVDVTMQLPGRIEGRVTDASGPVGAANVAAERFVVGHGWLTTRSTSSADDGRYRLDGVYPGRYRVSFNAKEHASEYYSNAADADASEEVIVVGGETTTGIDASMERSSSLNGRVVGRGGVGLPGIEVHLGREDGPGNLTQVTDDSGNFTFPDLQAGEYGLQFRDPNRRYLESTRQQSVERSADVSIGTIQMTGASGLAGRVVDDRGRSAPGVSVNVVAFEGGQLGEASADTTDAAGRFRLDFLTSGPHYVWFTDAKGRWLPEIWKDATRPADASTIQIPVGEVRSGFEAAVSRAARIRVRMNARPGPLSFPVQVPQVFRKQGTRWRKVSPTVHPVVSNGTLTLGGLRPGRYRIGFVASDGRHLEWWKDARKAKHAKVLRLSHGEGATISPVLDCGRPLRPC